MVVMIQKLKETNAPAPISGAGAFSFSPLCRPCIVPFFVILFRIWNKSAKREGVVMANVLPVIVCGVIGVLLLVGAYTDYKTRTIPNAVPIGILVCGIFTATPWWFKFFSLGFMVLFLALSKKKSGGGDVKLYCALAFSLGLAALAFILVITLILNFSVALIRKRRIDKTERIPLCTFVAPAYIIYMLILAFI